MKQPSNRTPDEPSGNQRLVLSELLVLRAQEGSGQAYAQLVELWQQPLWRHAFHLTGREDAAWDVLQESWLGIGKGLPRLREAGLFRRWAYTIVTRMAVARLRHMPPIDFQELEHPERYAEQPGDDDEREHALFHLRAALKQLKHADRALVSLHYLEGFDLWELSRILKAPQGTLKSRLHRIRHQLKELLERMYHE